MTIDSLDFSVIVHDEDFDKKIDRIIGKAAQLNAEVSKLLNLHGAMNIVTPEDVDLAEKLNKKLQSRSKTITAMNTKLAKKVELEKQITSELQKQSNIPVNAQVINIDNSKHIERSAKAQALYNSEIRKTSALMMQLKNLTLTYFSVLGAVRLVNNFVRITAEFEKQRVSLEAILRDVNGADRIFEQIKSLAVKSPFTFKEMSTYTKQLSAFSVPMNELYETTKMLADVSAGLGVGMDRLILAYGQIRSASFLRGQEVRQLTEAGVPVLKELSKQLTEIEGKYVSVGEVFDKISARQVTFEMVEKVFKEMTSEGGKFYQMQEVLAGTLAGKLSNLTDAYQIMFSEIGEKTNGILVGTVDGLRNLATNYEDVGRTILKLVAIYGTYRAALVAVNALELARSYQAWARVMKVSLSTGRAFAAGLAQLAGNSKTLLRINGLLSKVNPYAALAAGAVAAVMIVAKLISKQNLLERAIAATTEAEREFSDSIINEDVKLRYLFNRLKNASEGSKEYNDAKKKILSTYDAYLSDLDRENLALGKQKEVYESLSIAVRQVMKDKAMESGVQKITDELTKEVDGITETLEGKLASLNLPSNVAQQIKEWVYGTANDEDLTQEAKDAINKNATIMRGLKLIGTTSIQLQKGALYNFGEMRKKVDEARTTAENEIENLGTKLDGIFKSAWKKPNEKEILAGWQSAVVKIREEAKEQGVTLNVNPEKLSLDAFVKEVRGQLSELDESIKLNEGINDEVANHLRKQLVYYKKINDEVLLGRATPKEKGGSKTDPRIRAIENEIAAYKLLKQEAQDYEESFGKEGAKKLVAIEYAAAYPEQVAKDWDAEIEKLLNDLSALGPAGEESAAKIRASFTKDGSKSLKDAIDAAERYRTEIEKWLQHDFGLSGEDIGFDVSKILVGLSTSNNGTNATINALKAAVDASEVYIRKKAEVAGQDSDKVWEEYRDAAYKAIDEIGDREKDANKRIAQERINDLAAAYVKSSLTNKFGTTKILSDWGDKSLAQINGIITGINEIIGKELGEIPDDIKAQAEEAGVSLEKLWELIKGILSADVENATDEKLKKVANIANGSISAVQKLSSSVSQLADNIESLEMKNFAKGLQSAADSIQTFSGLIAELMKSSDWVTIVVKIALFFLQKIVEGIITLVSDLDAATRQVSAAGKEYVVILDEMRTRNNDRIFGTDALDNLANSYDNLTRAAERYEAWMYHTGLRGKMASGVNEESWVAARMAGLRAELDHPTSFTDKEALQNELTIYEDWINAVERLKESYQDLFGTLSSDIVDTLLDNFAQVGDAVSDIDRAFSNLGETILKSVLNTYLLNNVLKKYEEGFTDAIDAYVKSERSQDDAASLAETIGKLAENIKGEVEGAGDALNIIISSFKEAGLYQPESSAETLSTGIKGFTEDTANLLASYINAIRADVAANRITIEGMSVDLKQILGLLPSTPTLAEYLTKIEANTYNNAENTASILARLDSVIGDGASSYVRIN